MTRLRSVVFSTVLIVFLCGPIALFAAERADVSLPGWLTSEDAAYLSGGVERTDLFERRGLREILGNGFRDAVEAEVGNYIPTKAAALLANASIQRHAIAASNALWGWPCYPTTFGDSHLYIPEQRAVAKWPRSSDPDTDEGLEAFCRNLSDYAAEHGDVFFTNFVVARSEASAANPARPLVSSSFTSTDTAHAMEASLGQAATVLCEDPDTLDAYYERFFRSDHHWRAYGAVLGYNQIARTLGKVELPLEVEPVRGPLYSGAYARNSLCLVEDEPTDLAYDFGTETLGKGNATEDGNAHTSYANATEQNKHWRFYDLFYDSFTYANGSGEGHVLLVCDSFGFALIRPLAEGFASVSCVNVMQAAVKSDQSLSALIEEVQPDTVLFVGDPSNYSTFCERNPQFFS